MTYPTNVDSSKPVTQSDAGAGADLGPLRKQLRLQPRDIQGFYLIGLGLFIGSMVLAQLVAPPEQKNLAAYPLLSQCIIAVGAIVALAVSLLGLNNAKTNVLVYQRGIRCRSLFKSLEIPLDGMTNLKWSSKGGTIVEYRDGRMVKSGKTLSYEIYSHLLRLASPAPALPPTIQPQTDLGAVVHAFKCDAARPKLLLGIFMFLGFATMPFWISGGHTEGRLPFALSCALIASVFFLLAYRESTRSLIVHEYGVAYEIGGKKIWSCQFLDLFNTSTIATTETTKILYAIPVTQRIYKSAIILHLKDGGYLKAVRVTQVPVVESMIRSGIKLAHTLPSTAYTDQGGSLHP